MISVKQVKMMSSEELIPEKHNYRKFKKVFRLQVERDGIRQR